MAELKGHAGSYQKSAGLRIEVVIIHPWRYAALVHFRIDAFIASDHKEVVHRTIYPQLLNIRAHILEVVGQGGIVKPQVAAALDKSIGIHIIVVVRNGLVHGIRRDIAVLSQLGAEQVGAGGIVYLIAKDPSEEEVEIPVPVTESIGPSQQELGLGAARIMIVRPIHDAGGQLAIVIHELRYTVGVLTGILQGVELTQRVTGL